MREHSNLRVAQRLWDAIAEGDARQLRRVLSEKCVWRMYGSSPLAGAYVGADEILGFMARVGELTSDLHSDLIDIYVSEAGAILRYSVHAVRGIHELDTEHLFMVRITEGRIADGVFAPVDQAKYDRFFTPH
jgi:ketosteroid isomerase-like protein